MRSERTATGASTAQVLLLEDSPSDRLMTTLALEEAGVPHRLHVVEYGIDVLRFVRQEAPFADAPRPDLILLDLNVPRMDGREILRLLKADPHLSTIPIVVLTTSSHPAEVRAAYEHHANAYLCKPAQFDTFVELMRATMQFWCTVIEPSPPPTATLSPVAGRSATGPRRLLLLEDSPSDAALVTAALEDASTPYLITHVPRLTDALESLRNARYDIVLSDLSLPDSNGLETIRLLAAIGQTAPIIALTGSYADVGEDVLMAGADDFLPKGDLSPVRLERVLRHAIRRRLMQLEELQSQRVYTVGRLAASVAHDMNNLLAAIRLTTEALRLKNRDDRVLVEELLSNVERGASMTRRLLTFGRRSEQNRVECEVNGAVSSSAAMIARLLRPEISLRLELTRESTTAMADVHQLEQAIVNLALNANDAMPGGGVLELATAMMVIDAADGATFTPTVSAGTYIAVTVADTGVGIPTDILHRIFDPFFTTKAEYEGTGLGLATVRDIARLHLGGIRATNRSNGGALFTLVIPSAAAGGRHAPRPLMRSTLASLPLAPASKSARQTILLAEDDEAVARATARVLTAEGYIVEIVGSADAAWRAWSTHTDGYDLLLTDLLMPGTMSVIDLVGKIRAVEKDFPMVFCSGYASASIEQTLNLIEQVNFVAKPFNTSDLLRVVSLQLATTAAPNPCQDPSSAPS